MHRLVFVLFAFGAFFCVSNRGTSAQEEATQCDGDVVLSDPPDSNLTLKSISSVQNGVLELDRTKFSTVERICQPFSDDEGIVEIQLNGIGLKHLHPGVFARLSKAVKVDLSDNDLKYIEEGVFSNTTISHLDLSRNHIERASSATFDHMPHLEHLFLDNNQLEGWHSDWFADSPQVRDVRISNNSLSALPAHALKNIKGCHLVDDHKVGSKVDFSRNRITTIHEDAFVDQKVFGFINLKGNSLTTIRPGVFGRMEYVNFVNFDSNPMLCPSTEVFASLHRVLFYSMDDTNWDEAGGDECLLRMNEANRQRPRSFTDKLEFPDEECS